MTGTQKGAADQEKERTLQLYRDTINYYWWKVQHLLILQIKVLGYISNDL